MMIDKEDGGLIIFDIDVQNNFHCQNYLLPHA